MEDKDIHEWNDDSLVRGDQIPLEVPEYVWDGLIPTNGVTHIVGPSGVGKSTFAMMLAAKWTTGELTGKPEMVVAQMTEDKPDGMVTLPRLLLMGGDQIHSFFPPETRWKFPRDFDKLKYAIGISGARIVILDALRGMIQNITTQAGSESLDVIQDMAKELGVSIIFLHHYIKGATSAKTVADAIGGGYGIYGIPRSILVLGYEPMDVTRLLKIRQGQTEPDPNEPVGQRIVMAHEKLSAGELHPSIMYARQKRPHPADPQNSKLDVSVFVEVKQVDYTPLQVMHAVPEGQLHEIGNAVEQAKAVILMLLANAGEDGLKAKELEGRVKAAGFSEITLFRARAELHSEGMIEREQRRNRMGRVSLWVWRLVVPDTIEDF